MRMVGGKVMMDRNAPEALRDTPQRGYDESKALHREMARAGTARLCDHAALRHHLEPGQMEMAEALAREYPDLHPDACRREPRRRSSSRASCSQAARTISASMSAITCSGQDAARPLHPSDASRSRGAGSDAGRRSVLSDVELCSSARACSTTTGSPSTARGSRSRPTWAAAPAIRCCGRSTRATRCCSCRPAARSAAARST